MRTAQTIQEARNETVFVAARADGVTNAPAPHKPMKVVHIIKHCGYGNGNVHVAVDLACIQARAGDDVTFVSNGGTFEPLLAKYGVRHLKLEQEQNKPFSLLRSAWKLIQFARAHRPDVLHAHMMSSAMIGYAASKCSGVPLVTTVHNSFDKHSRLMRLGHKVVAVSQAEKASLLGQGYAARQLVSIMNAPFGSPREEFMCNTREIVIESPCVVAASGLHHRKGVADLVSACAEVFPAHPEWKLYIAGEGPDRQALELLAQSLNVAERVIFLGFVPSPTALLKKADIFVLASYADPCSLVIGEARGAGCAIVATAVGGTPEMLEFGRAGRLVSPAKPAQLALELRTLMADNKAREELRAASLQGSEIFNVERLLEEYAAVYESAAAAVSPKLAGHTDRSKDYASAETLKAVSPTPQQGGSTSW